MAAKTHEVDGDIILYDDALIDQAAPALFSPEHWRRQDRLRMIRPGRGVTWVVGGASGDWVLRHYRRGGLLGRAVKDHYLWAGLRAARPWREWHLLDALHKCALPVPRPVAARVSRRFLAYQGDILTELIEDVITLARRVRDLGIGAINWARIGGCLRRFHEAGVYHADLNAYNILLTPDEQVYVVDFDRGRLRHDHTGWRKANLKRLKRSLYKIAVHEHALVEGMAWPDLMRAYEAG